jgi:hypothetical protein
MTVRTSAEGVIVLSGRCDSDDAESLLQALLVSTSPQVDWTACEYAHSAVIQVLLIARPVMRGEPGAEALRRWISPMIARAAH